MTWTLSSQQLRKLATRLEDLYATDPQPSKQSASLIESARVLRNMADEQEAPVQP